MDCFNKDMRAVVTRDIWELFRGFIRSLRVTHECPGFRSRLIVCLFPFPNHICRRVMIHLVRVICTDADDILNVANLLPIFVP